MIAFSYSQEDGSPEAEAAAFRSTEADKCSNSKPLCIFDFDYTLKLGSSYHCCGYLPNDAIEAVNECISSNFDLAIASANTHWQFVRSFLRDKIPQFTGLLYTEAVQTGQSWKTSSLSKVLGHYNMTNASECSVFFDDLWENKKFADGLGIPFVKVSPSSGVTTGNVKNGIGLVREKCPCRFN